MANTPTPPSKSPPAKSPAKAPSNAQSKAPSKSPSNAQSKSPSKSPSNAPSNAPSNDPSNAPSVEGVTEATDLQTEYPYLYASLESGTKEKSRPIKIKDTQKYVKESIMSMGKRKAKELDKQWESADVAFHEMNAKKARATRNEAKELSKQFTRDAYD